MEFGTDLLLHGIAYTSRFRLTPIGARTNDNDFVFAIPKMYHNPVMHNGSPRCRWQTYTCVGSGICCRENFPKFLTWAEPDPKRRFFRYTAYRKSFTTNQWCRWKGISVRPSDLLPSWRTKSTGSLATGTPSATKARAMRLFSMWCLDIYQGPVCRQGRADHERRPANHIGKDGGHTSPAQDVSRLQPWLPRRTLRKCAFWSHKPPDIKIPICGNPKPTKNFGSKIYLIHHIRRI